jgi:hypothetical protein
LRLILPSPLRVDEYIEQSGEIIREQLAKAGVRLAGILNRCFARLSTCDQTLLEMARPPR